MFLLGHLFGFVSAYAAGGRSSLRVCLPAHLRPRSGKASVKCVVYVSVLRQGDFGDPSLPNTVTSLTEFVAVGGTQGETLHYCCSAGMASGSLPREGLGLGDREGKGGKNITDSFNATHENVFFPS